MSSAGGGLVNGRLDTRLPVPLTSFVGRDSELDELAAMIRASRLVTVTGAAGLGKTRLAIEVAGRAAGDVRFAGLVALTEGALVPHEVAASLGVSEQVGDALLNTLAEHIGSRALLLVLDNCEHVVEDCARLVEALLRDCVNLRVLATSRQPLRVPGEQVWPIAPMRLPDRLPDALQQAAGSSEAVRLFEARARLVRPEFSVTPANARSVTLACRTLEGIPLAIELAAARLQTLSVDDVVRRLEDRFRLLAGGGRTAVTRHRTLRAALDWGDRLLDRRERRLFRRLSVFRGGFDLGAVEAVCGGAGIEPDEVGDLVFRLAEKSLLVPDTSRPGPARYRLLETVRQYGARRLARSGDGTWLLERHAAHFLELGVRAEPEERGLDQQRWLERLEADLGNLRAALAWHRAHDVDAWLRLASSLSWFWVTHSHYSEGRIWLEAALAAAAEDAPARSDGMLAMARLCFLQGDYGSARTWCDACLAARRRQGDDTGCGWALTQLGAIHAYLGEYAEGRRRFEEALAATCDELVRMEALVGLGEMLVQAGDLATARARLEEVLRLARGPDAPRGRAALFLGLVAFFSGNRAGAAGHLSRALDIFHRLGNHYAAAGALDAFAALAGAGADPVRALRLCGAASALRDSTRSQLAPRWREMVRTVVIEPAWAAAGDAAGGAWEEGRRMTLDDAVRLAGEGPPAARPVRAPHPRPVAAPVRGGPAGLTRRELEVADLVMQGMSNGQIAERLVIAERTVEGHVERLRSKLNVHSRTEIGAAILRARAWPSKPE
jgi:predicted ATPase/DNA-binding CsgD family transcriptional regulator